MNYALELNIMIVISLFFFLFGVGTGYLMSLRYNNYYIDEHEEIYEPNEQVNNYQPVDSSDDVETGLNHAIYNDYFGSGSVSVI